MKLLKYLALVLFVVLACALPVQAQTSTTGATSITVNLPNIIILHYFSSATIGITDAELLGYMDFTFDHDTSVDEGAATTTGAFPTYSLGMVPTYPGTGGDLTAVNVTLEDAWGVRAIGNGNVTMSIAVTTALLSHATAGTISMTGATIVAPTSFAPPGLVNPRVGDITLTFNLTNAVRSGNYTGGLYTITAQIP